MYDFKFDGADRFTAWFLVSQTRAAMTRVTEKELAKIGLTPEKAKVLWLCHDYPPPLTPAELSRLMFRKSHSVAGLIDRMETDGLVRRVPKRKGHPFTEVQLTEKGQALVNPAKDVVVRYITELMAPLSNEEVDQLRDVLTKLRGNVLERLRLDLKPWHGNGYEPAPTYDCRVAQTA